MTSGISGNLLLLGKVLRPHGLRGIVCVQSYAQSAASFTDAEEILLRPVSGETLRYKVFSASPHKHTVLMKLEGVNSVEDAERLKDAEILADICSIPREDGEYFWQELIGLGVFLDTGTYIGDVTRIIATGGNDIYVVEDAGEEIFIPAIYETVQEIDLEKGRMVIRATEGLLDLNEV